MSSNQFVLLRETHFVVGEMSIPCYLGDNLCQVAGMGV